MSGRRRRRRLGQRYDGGRLPDRHGPGGPLHAHSEAPMSEQVERPARRSQKLRSVGVVALAFFGNAIVTTITDQIFHVLDVYPPWGQPMHEPSLNALALSYRIVFAV